MPTNAVLQRCSLITPPAPVIMSWVRVRVRVTVRVRARVRVPVDRVIDYM